MTAGSSTQDKKLGEQLAYLVGCTNTMQVLTVLAERVASPKEIADILGLHTSNVAHHIKKLLRLRMIELVDERDVGGTMQHFYRAIIRPLVSTEEWERLSLVERQQFSIWIVQLILADAAISFDTGLFDARASRHLSRTPMVADNLGFDEIAEIQNRALEEIIQTQAVIADRMAREGTTGVNAIAAMMCFELPGPSEGPASIGDAQFQRR